MNEFMNRWRNEGIISKRGMISHDKTLAQTDFGAANGEQKVVQPDRLRRKAEVLAAGFRASQ